MDMMDLKHMMMTNLGCFLIAIICASFLIPIAVFISSQIIEKCCRVTKKKKLNLKEEKPGKGKKEEKKKEAKPEKVEKAETPAAEAPAMPPKKKDPLDELPAGTFNMEDWKRFFSNNPEEEAIKYF